MNTHPLHFDNAYAQRTEFKARVGEQLLTLSIVVGMSVSDVSQKAIANLGWRDIKLTAPVFVGDTVYCRVASAEQAPNRRRVRRWVS